MDARGDFASKLRLAINDAPQLTIADVLRCSFAPDAVLPALLPLATEAARTTFRETALRYMELCVLEDKLNRLIETLESVPEDAALPTKALVDELACVRRWDTAEHPRWLAIEVERQLQIRPEQYTVARHLLDHPARSASSTWTAARRA